MLVRDSAAGWTFKRSLKGDLYMTFGTKRAWRDRAIPIIGLCLFFLLASTGVGEILASPIPPSLDVEDSRGLPGNFSLVPNSIELIQDEFLVALYESATTGQVAFVVFSVNCESERCT